MPHTRSINSADPTTWPRLHADSSAILARKLALQCFMHSCSRVFVVEIVIYPEGTNIAIPESEGAAGFARVNRSLINRIQKNKRRNYVDT